MQNGLDADGISRTRDLTLNTVSLVFREASVGNISVTGFRDITIARNFPSVGNVAFTAERNLTIDPGTTLTAGPTSAFTLRAAGGNNNGRGVFLNNGVIQTGTSELELVSGLDATGNPVDIILNPAHYTLLGIAVSDTVINGFRNITLDMDWTSTGDINWRARRNLTLNTGTTLTSGSNKGTTLQAANGDRNNLGVLTLNGLINTGTRTLNLVTGYDSAGNRPDFTWDNTTKIRQQIPSVVGFTIAGFRDVMVASDILSGQYISITAYRNLNINSGVNLTTSLTNSTSLLAANNDPNGLGILSINGMVNFGGMNLSLNSGLDNANNRADLVLDATHFNHMTPTSNSATITGFRDIRIGMDMDTVSTSAPILITASRDLTIDSGVTLTSAADITLSAGRSFINHGGANALGLNGNGRWLVYSLNTATNTPGDLPYDFRTYNCQYAATCSALPATGNGFVFANSATSGQTSGQQNRMVLPAAVTALTQSRTQVQTSITPVVQAANSKTETSKDTPAQPESTFLVPFFISDDPFGGNTDSDIVFTRELAERFRVRTR